jgi:hypothetical protein
MSFWLGHGVNVSHWLSQSPRRGAERRAWFTEADVERIASTGFDHVRFPVDEEQLWDEEGRREPEAFELLEQALGWCERAELRAIVDLHIVRSHYFKAASRPLFVDPAEQDKFCALWRDLSEALAHWPLEQVAYELLNEPVRACRARSRGLEPARRPNARRAARARARARRGDRLQRLRRSARLLRSARPRRRAPDPQLPFL